MLDELMGEAKADGFFVSEIITDKDSSMNAVYRKHFPEGTITYCANHCAKTLHKDLLKIKPSKCQVTKNIYDAIGSSALFSVRQKAWGSASACQSSSLAAVQRHSAI